MTAATVRASLYTGTTMLSSADTREGYHSRSRMLPAAGIMAVVPRAIRPLQGLRIVSLAQNLPGPLALSRLVAAGAAALKIEPPAGDGFRQLAPRWYRHLHRGVRLQTLDLKSDVGRLALSAEAVAVARNAWAFIASPLRAIADAVYLAREVTWSRNGLGYLTESLRIEEDDLRSLSFEAMEEILDSIRSRRVRAYLEGLKGAVGHAG